MDPSVAVAMTGLITMQGVNLFTQHAPKLADLRKGDKYSDRNLVLDLRVAELEAAAVMILAGIAVAAMSGQSVPAWLAIVSAGMMIAIYEWALASPAV